MAEKLFDIEDAGLGIQERWNAHLQSKLDVMQEKRRGKNPVRLSSAGACQRKLWYQKWHSELGAGFGTRMLDSFAIGDAVEQIIKFRLHEIYGTDYFGFRLICKQCAAERKVYTPECAMCGSGAFYEFEDDCELKLTLSDGSEAKVPGHVDGFLRIDGKVYITEVKTMANFTFGRTKGRDGAGGLSYDYAAQATAYQKATGIYDTIFVAVRKETGELCFRRFRGNKEILEQVSKRLTAVIESNPETPLEREFAPTVPKSPKGALTLGFPCSYCEFVEHCYPSFNKEFVDKKDYVTGSVSRQPMLIDRSGKFPTPEEARLSVSHFRKGGQEVKDAHAGEADGTAP